MRKGWKRVAALLSVAVLLAGSISTSVSAQEAGTRTVHTAEMVLDAAEEIADSVEVRAKDPTKSDTIITGTGKRLSRSDGKWILPEEQPESADSFTLLYAGDIIFDATQNPGIYKAQRSGIRACFDDAAWERMQSADLFVINQEFPYTDRGTAAAGKQFTFRCDPTTVDWLVETGADVAALANNHIYDFGAEGAMDTFDTLDEAEVPYIGAGRNLEEATQTAYYIANGMAVALLNATEIERYENSETRGATQDSPGVFRCLQTDRLCEEVAKAKTHADLVIVYVHWGTELQGAADADQERIARDLQEAGADLVIGSHPHVLQNIQYIEEMPVFYSLGNYFFSAATRDNGVLQIELDTTSYRIRSLQFVPMSQQQGVRTLYGAEKERVLSTMRSVSPGVDIDEDGYFKKK